MEEEHILSATPLVYCNYKRLDIDSGTICRGLHFHAEVEAVYTERGSRLPCHSVPTTIYCGWDFILPQNIDRCPKVAPKVALKVALKSFFTCFF